MTINSQHMTFIQNCLMVIYIVFLMLSMDDYLFPEINHFEGFNCINVSSFRTSS